MQPRLSLGTPILDGRGQGARIIRKAADSLEQTTGQRPAGWLSRYLHTEVTRRLLVEEGYTYHMDDYSDDFPFWETVEMADGAKKPMLIMPYALDSNDMKFWLAPSLTARDWLAYATSQPRLSLITVSHRRGSLSRLE